MMTVRQIFDDLLSTLGVENPDTSPAVLRLSALSSITAALQLMQNAGEDFYGREEIPVALEAGTGSYDLPTEVQTVLGPARISSGKRLVALTSRSMLDQFAPLCMGSLEDLEQGTPIAYFVESLRGSSLDTTEVSVSGAGLADANGTYSLLGVIDGETIYTNPQGFILGIYPLDGAAIITWPDHFDCYSCAGGISGSWTTLLHATGPAPSVAAVAEADSVRIRLHVAPTPKEADTLTLDAIKEPPAYTMADLCGNSPVPPVPHKYHESILLPLCRMNITTNPHFARHKDKLPQIEADYLRALTLLGLADPRRPKPDESNSNRLKSIAAPQGGQQ